MGDDNLIIEYMFIAFKSNKQESAALNKNGRLRDLSGDRQGRDYFQWRAATDPENTTVINDQCVDRLACHQVYIWVFVFI